MYIYSFMKKVARQILGGGAIGGGVSVQSTFAGDGLSHPWHSTGGS